MPLLLARTAATKTSISIIVSIVSNSITVSILSILISISIAFCRPVGANDEIWLRLCRNFSLTFPPFKLSDHAMYTDWPVVNKAMML